ncbi:ATP-binding protein [Chelativorans sp. Marseille-P2723]|uniref:ATP-binding protein n=1 Tax=Chelativorans sp. Marseille-P2723 TaxID=2709133 RepID=UPI00157014E5|nr:ATP-binding protein [Chelativorans sp. Marseille-P2723]
MYVGRNVYAGERTSQERRAADQPHERVLGHVVQCDGSRAIIATTVQSEAISRAGSWTVGKIISINLGEARTVGLIYAVECPQRRWDAESANPIMVSVELVGEVRDVDGQPVFDRGISEYPHIGAVAHHIRANDLRAIYDLSGKRSILIGHLSQDNTIEATLAIDETLNRHFAFVGTTGVGKSTAVSLLLRKTLASRPDLRVLILDPHNEFAAALPEYSVRIDTSTLDLPFWLFRLEELVEVLYRGRDPVTEEVELLRDLIAHAKYAYASSSGGGGLRRSSNHGSLTADTPVPYRMAEVIREIDERIGQLEAKNDRPHYRQLRARIDAAINDPRYRFMFSSRLIEDSIHETIGQIFRVPSKGRPVTCFEMAGLPSEVVNSVCSVLARLAFDLTMWSEGKLKLLLLCEEAHRYMPADPQLGFGPTRHALSRIAKEGRKYGCYLGVVTQRPVELDPTVLSQCSTVFAMRLANEDDQAIIRSAIADSAASTLTGLSAMSQREAIAFGDGVATTMRMKFETLPDDLLPGAKDGGGSAEEHTAGLSIDDFDLATIVARMRDTGKRNRTLLGATPPKDASMLGSVYDGNDGLGAESPSFYSSG